MQAKNSRVRIYHNGQQPEIKKLEINKLGRPYHKIPEIFKDKFDVFDGKLSIYFLKKLRVNMSLKAIDCQMDISQKQTRIFSSDIGYLAFYIERTLLLNILHDYYGLSNETSENKRLQEEEVTKTEERLKHRLSHELVTLLTDSDIFGHPLQIKPDYISLENQWSWRITFILDRYEGTFSLFLDHAHINYLCANLRRQADTTPFVGPEHQTVNLQASFMALPVRLIGRLAALPLTVADLSRLKSGDVLPIMLADRIPLFIGQQPLFNAVIAEDHGKLFFSEMTDKNSEKPHD